MTDTKQPRLVVAVNRDLAMAMLDDRTLVPVTNWIGEDGEDCEAKDAVVCVAGTDKLGWWTIDLSFYHKPRVH